MRILIVAPHIKIFGLSGAAIHHMEFTRALTKLGIEVHILADTEKRIRLGKKIFLHPANVSKIQPKRFLTSLFSIKRGIEICKNHNIDIIHDRCDPGQIAGYLIAKIVNRPRLAEINYNFLSYEIKGNFLKDVLLYPLLQKVKKWWIKYIVKDSDVITTVSKTIKDSLVKEGLPEKKINAVPNGANPKFFKISKKSTTARERYDLGGNDIVLTIIGELGPRQAIRETALAVHKLKNKFPNIKLILVGSEKRYQSYLNEIKSLVKKNNMGGHIKFVDSVPHEKLPEFLSAVDLALAPYKDSWNTESFGFSPIKVFEYMAAKKVVVTTKTKWNEEIISDGKDGFLINLSRMDKDLEKIILTIIRNKRLTKLMVNRARKKIETTYNWDNIAKAYVKIYKDLCKTA